MNGIDFSTLKQGQKVSIDGQSVQFEARVSKGRKMLERCIVTSTREGIIKRHGCKYKLNIHTLSVEMIFDYGKTIETTGRAGGGSESFNYPKGTTSNRWDLYNYYFNK